MQTLPMPRSRFYGRLSNYGLVAANLLRGRINTGTDVDSIEKEVSTFLGKKHAIAMPQARVGIYLTLKNIIQPGQKVVLSPYTIHEVINMVICTGGRPVFADIERETCNIDTSKLDSLIDDETGAVMVTHLHGLACNLTEAQEVCARHGVPLIEDAAQAFGAKHAGKRAGTFGKAGVLSFGMAKNINSLYGGMVVTDDDDLAASLRSDIAAFAPMDTKTLVQRAFFCLVGNLATTPPWFWLGPYWLFRHGCLHEVEALNKPLRGESDPVRKETFPDDYRRQLTQTQAKLVHRQIPAVDSDTAVRTSFAKRYHEGLKDIQQILLPPLHEDGSHIYQSFPIQVPDRIGLMKFMMTRLRDVTIQHLRNTADIECYSDFKADCPNARATADQVLLLPTYPSYGIKNVDANIEIIRQYFASRE